MPHPSAPRLLVLHALRLKGCAEADALAAVVGLDPEAVADACRDLTEEGSALRRDGRLSGWSLTPDGRAAHCDLVAAELRAADARPAVEGAYGRFLDLNGGMLGACTRWQLRDADGAQVVNDHTDAAWDAAVLDDLCRIDAAVQPVLEALAAALDRYGRYRGRFASALARLRAGELEWFTRPVIDSYHTVWFELHEDLLCTLGIERASEAQRTC